MEIVSRCWEEKGKEHFYVAMNDDFKNLYGFKCINMALFLLDALMYRKTHKHALLR